MTDKPPTRKRQKLADVNDELVQVLESMRDEIVQTNEAAMADLVDTIKNGFYMQFKEKMASETRSTQVMGLAIQEASTTAMRQSLRELSDTADAMRKEAHNATLISIALILNYHMEQKYAMLAACDEIKDYAKQSEIDRTFPLVYMEEFVGIADYFEAITAWMPTERLWQEARLATTTAKTVVTVIHERMKQTVENQKKCESKK